MNKRFFCILAGLLALTSAYGQSFLESVYLSLDKGLEGVYAKDDTIKVYAEVDRETPALVKVYQNGQFKGVTDKLLPPGKSEVFRGSYKESAALMIRLANPSDQKDSTTIGAIVAPEGFRPGYRVPADFRSFWNRQIKTMRLSPRRFC